MANMTHREYADSLRRVADWFEAHPEVKIPHDADRIGLYNVHSQEDMATVARAFGACEKEYTDGYFKLNKTFGGITVQAVASRTEVCKKKIVGSRVVPASVIEVPARVEEIVEWECFDTALLKPAAEPIPIDAPLAQAIRHDAQVAREAEAEADGF